MNQSPDAVLHLLKCAYKLSDAHPIKLQLMPELSGEQTSALAYKSAQEGNSYSAMYYGCLAAFKGDPNGFILFVNTALDNQHKHYLSIGDVRHTESIKSGLDYLISILRVFSWNDTFNAVGINQYNDIESSIQQYCEETHEQLYGEYKAEINERKKLRRIELWSNIGKALLTTAVNIGNQYISYQQNIPSSYSNAFNINQLLDPRLAMVQVDNQLMNEYNSFCYYNKKADGSSYSYDEWMNIRAQAYFQIPNVNAVDDSSYSQRSIVPHSAF